MPITVGELLELPGLGLTAVAGQAGLAREIRCAHTSELQDPTPWLSGGEFLLSTGMDLGASAALQRSYLRRLVRAGLSGLGFGVGFTFDQVPQPLIRAADREGFPILEVPYPVPFIAISEAIAARLAEDQVREVQLSVEVSERLAALVTDGAGPADVLDELAELAEGWSLVFDNRGQVLAASHGAPVEEAGAIRAALPQDFAGDPAAVAGHAGRGGGWIALPVVSGKRPEGVLVFGKAARPDGRDRMVVGHARTVMGLLLAARRAVIDTERRIAGDTVGEAVAGRVAGEELRRRLALLGFAEASPLTVVVGELRDPTSTDVLEDLEWSLDGAWGRRVRKARTSICGHRIVSVVSAEDVESLARAVVNEVEASEGALRLGVGTEVPGERLRDSYLAATFALRAAPVGSVVATPRDLGSYSFLLRNQSPQALEGFVRATLGPLLGDSEEETPARGRADELLRSVAAFVSHGGRWEQGAEALGVHRHTLRYRINQAEQLLGRDLSDAEDQLEVLLALKALEILEA